jgi:excisionase family DNA binding protein
MRHGEMFDLTELRVPLSQDQKDAALRGVVSAARLGIKYAYTIKEAAGILSLSRDGIDYLIHSYRLDALCMGAVYRIPWYSLAGYLLDTGDDIDAAFYEFVRSRHRPA